MVIGMDVYKDGQNRNKSVASFVASMNGLQENKLNCTRFFSRCELQEKGQEFSDNLQKFMTDALKMYNEKNKVLPERIFIYRDGVSDGQFAVVSKFEVPQLRNAFKTITENYKY
jgi:hypothetical protein